MWGPSISLGPDSSTSIDQLYMEREIDIVVLQVGSHGCFCDLRMGDTFTDLHGNLCCKLTDQPNGIDNTCILRARSKDETETLCWLTGLAPVTQVFLT